MKLRAIAGVLLGVGGLSAAACGGSPGGTGGSGATGGTGASTGSPVPAEPDTAWVVNMTGGTGCTLSDSMIQFGNSSVNATSIDVRVTDQEVVNGPGQVASVLCAVIPLSGGAFEVQAQTDIGADTLSVNIPDITLGANVAQPVAGSITYESTATVQPYSGMCNFYFASPPESVGTGKFWAAFTCAGLVDAQANPVSTCPVVESYLALENCGATPIF